MTFIITLVSLVLERFFHWGHLRHWRWFKNYQRWLSHTRASSLPSLLLLLIVVLPPVLLVGLVNSSLSTWLYCIPKLLFGILVLMYCLGPSNLWAQAYSCMSELHKADPGSALNQVNTAFATGFPETSQAFHQAFVRAIFLSAYQRVFGVVFWFVILGPVGAVLYRTIALLSAESPLALTQQAQKLIKVIDWLPVRIFTFLFALGGHFTSAIVPWRRDAAKGPYFNEGLIAECGIAALAIQNAGQIPEEGSAEKESLALLDRVFVIGLVILAVSVLLV